MADQTQSLSQRSNHMYSAKTIGKIEYAPGTWSGVRVGVFRIEGEAEEQIGEYERNYPNLLNTFCPFQKDGKDYALYSPDYTATRLMALPSCEDIGGEEHDSVGFCPVDFYVPTFIEREYVALDDKIHRYRVNEPGTEHLIATTTKYSPLDETTGERIVVEKPDYPVGTQLYYPFGFVAGCIWGDDTSWKIEYLDLSEAERGILKREQRFGYVALPSGMTLKQAVSMEDYLYDPQEDWAYTITIAIQRRFDLRTGKTVDDNPFS